MRLTAFDVANMYRAAGRPVPPEVAAAVREEHPGSPLPAAWCVEPAHRSPRLPQDGVSGVGTGKDPDACPEGRENADLLMPALALLKRLKAAGQITAFWHRPDQKSRGREAGGVPDLLVALGPDRGIVALELKTATGKVTPEQAVWLAAFGDRGCVCRSLAAVRAFLAGFGVCVEVEA